ncbi:MAG TPA: response regulator [Sunxiuqinia sp.]|nr:response regulator [Sunxiuqinia sp.]
MGEKQKKRIVLAEDSVSIREAIVFGLEEEGYFVETAENGALALQKFDGTKIDLLLTDYHMPEMTGLELIEKVRELENYRHTPILVLTTENQKELILQAKNAGGTGWLQKPFKIEKLVQTVRRLIH